MDTMVIWKGKTIEEILGMAWTVAAFLDDSPEGIIVWTGDKEQDDML
jgi:hypothetical protein